MQPEDERDDDAPPDSEESAPDASEVEQEEALVEALESLDELAQEDPEEALSMFETLPEEVQTLPDFQLALAGLLRATEDLEGAKEVLESLVESDAEDADAHHALGDVLEDLGDLERATTHFLRVLELDTLAVAERPAAELEELLDETLQHLKTTVEELPKEWHERLKNVPLEVARLPSEDLVKDGLDPRALGLFEGPTHAEQASADAIPVPTRIVLFAENLDLDFPDPEDFEDQVRVTVWHELGHYFGLGEEDMERLGLD